MDKVETNSINLLIKLGNPQTGRLEVNGPIEFTIGSALIEVPKGKRFIVAYIEIEHKISIYTEDI